MFWLFQGKRYSFGYLWGNNHLVQSVRMHMYDGNNVGSLMMYRGGFGCSRSLKCVGGIRRIRRLYVVST